MSRTFNLFFRFFEFYFYCQSYWTCLTKFIFRYRHCFRMNFCFSQWPTIWLDFFFFFQQDRITTRCWWYLVREISFAVEGAVFLCSDWLSGLVYVMSLSTTLFLNALFAMSSKIDCIFFFVVCSIICLYFSLLMAYTRFSSCIDHFLFFYFVFVFVSVSFSFRFCVCFFAIYQALL